MTQRLALLWVATAVGLVAFRQLGDAELARLRLSQNGLNYAAVVARKVVQSEAKIVGTKIPGFKKSALRFYGGSITHFTCVSEMLTLPKFRQQGHIEYYNVRLIRCCMTCVWPECKVYGIENAQHFLKRSVVT